MTTKKKSTDKPLDIQILNAVRGEDTRERVKSEQQRVDEQGIKQDILEALRRGVDHKFVVRLNGYEFFMRLLSVEESNRILKQASLEFSAYPDDQKIPLIHTRNVMELTIDAATSSAPGALDGWGRKTLKALTAGELAAIYEEWAEIEQRCDPSVDRMTQEEFDLLLDELEKKPHLLNECSLKQLRRIVQEWLQIRRELMDSSSTSY